MPGIDYTIQDEIETVSEVESDLNWETQTLLDDICASVANVADDLSADVACYPELFESEAA